MKKRAATHKCEYLDCEELVTGRYHPACVAHALAHTEMKTRENKARRPSRSTAAEVGAGANKRGRTAIPLEIRLERDRLRLQESRQKSETERLEMKMTPKEYRAWKWETGFALGFDPTYYGLRLNSVTPICNTGQHS